MKRLTFLIGFILNSLSIYCQTQNQDLNMGLYELQFTSASGGSNRIQSFGGSGSGTWLFKSRFDDIVFKSGENDSNKRNIIFSIGDTEKARLNTFGYFGLGISPVSRFHIRENNANTNQSAGITIEQSGTGDSKLQFLISSAQRWVTGIDNSDSDKFVIGRGIDWSQSKNLVIDNVGKVGIGTTTPSKQLEVNGTTKSNNFMTSATNSTYSQFTRDGTGAALYINQVQNNANLPILRLSSGTATANQNVRFTVENDGSVGIGTTTLGSHKLAVEGTIGAREIKVESGAWSDFVFDTDYELRPLKELETFIVDNKHLPEIPSEAEVIENGINLGEMDAKLLQKIEELTLYLIEQNKKIEELQKEVVELKKAN